MPFKIQVEPKKNICLLGFRKYFFEALENFKNILNIQA